MSKETVDRGLALLRYLPRLSLSNLKDNIGKRPKKKRGRAQHGGDKHGAGNKGSGQRQNFMRIGYETGNNPFYLRFQREFYYAGHHLKRQYLPMSMLQLQQMIDTNRLDISKPVDLVTLLSTGVFFIKPDQREFGLQLTDEGADIFKAKINLEIQWATEPVIAAIEKNGGTITTAYYDMHSLQAMTNPQKFFERGIPIPRRMIPPQDAMEFYSGAENRGYLADPEKISEERFKLAQKYGYVLPRIEDDPDYEMLTERKDPRQIFHGLHPGWVVNLRDRVILKPKDEELLKFYAS